MQKLSVEENQSENLVQQNIEHLKRIFPEVFSEGKVNFETLRQLLGDQDVLDEGKEKYGLNWHGKKKARQSALTPSLGTLLPCPEESVDWDSTQNLFIEGDNLEVLKLLQKSYTNKVKLIYIDPPYNTGKDFVYHDNFHENIEAYLKYTNQQDENNLLTTSNVDSVGRKHSTWLSMIYPRIKLARELLAKDGIILVSIDENECTNLKHVCDSVLGEENFIAQLVWEKGRKNDAKFFSVGHEYILVYAKNLSFLKDISTIWREPKEGAAELWDKYLELKKQNNDNYEVMTIKLRDWFKELPESHPSKKLARYKHIDKYGPWRDADISWPGGGGPKYDVKHPKTGESCQVPDRGWRFSTLASMQKKIDQGFVIFRDDHTSPPISKAHLRTLPENLDEIDLDINDESVEIGSQVMPSVIYKQSQVAIKYFNKLMGERIFTNPKDHVVLARLIKYICQDDSIILDFFSGSCSTAEAVLEVNVEKNTKHRYIMVQLPEKCPVDSVPFKAGYKTIAEIGKERIRRVGANLKKLNPSLDIGFKVFKLAQSNIQPWNPDPTDLETTLLDSENHLIEGRTEQDILYELLLKRGIDLAAPIQERKVREKTIYSIGYGSTFACLDENIQANDVESIAQVITDWYQELVPGNKPHIFFRDSAFENDVVKTNIAAILKQNGLDHVRSL